MKTVDRFIDTNVLLYLLSADDIKANCAEEQLANGGVLSVQVLNEFSSVASRKLKMSIAEIRDVLTIVRAICKIVPITVETHDSGLEIADRYGLSIYDAMIIAAAKFAGCKTVLSEDMQHNQMLEGLTIINPFL